MLSKGLAYRKNNPGELFTDVRYTELVQSPVSALNEIYRHHGNIPPDLLRRFNEADKKNAPNRFGRHVYDLNDFDLTSEDILDKTKFYKEFLETQRI